MNKAHSSAVGLNIGTGFAHMRSIVQRIWVIWNLSQNPLYLEGRFLGARLGIVTTNRGFWVKNGSNLGRLDAPGYIMGRDVTFSNVLPLIMEKDRLRDIRTILNLSPDPITVVILSTDWWEEELGSSTFHRAKLELVLGHKKLWKNLKKKKAASFKQQAWQ